MGGGEGRGRGSRGGARIKEFVGRGQIGIDFSRWL